MYIIRSLHPEPIFPQLFGVCFTSFRAVLSHNVLINILESLIQTVINNFLSLLANHVNHNMSRAVALNLIKHS
jgi:hypothetical protein